MSSDSSDAQDVIRKMFPHGTHKIEIQGVSGWVYEIFDTYGAKYTLFLFHDGTQYQVKVVFPEVERHFDRRSILLSDEGALYPGLQSNSSREPGFSNVLDAFRESVLWVNRFGFHKRAHEDAERAR